MRRGALDRAGSVRRLPRRALPRATRFGQRDDADQRDGRRLGGLLIGVGSQAGRPLSLAAEWAPIAEEVLEGHTAEGVALPRRLRTHLTGIR